MSDNKNIKEDKIDSEYLKFVKERLENTNWDAENKLKRIDELRDMIFTARKDYINKK